MRQLQMYPGAAMGLCWHLGTAMVLSSFGGETSRQLENLSCAARRCRAATGMVLSDVIVVFVVLCLPSFF